MLADGPAFTYEEDIDTIYRVTSYNANKVSESMHS